ncbi:MAG: S8 family serine peptidase [Chloroflexi bacterium]|nr:S8 family serine peptidase [Chloroflexota bacterium]
MRNKSWKFIATLSAVIVLVSVVGSYDVAADGSRLVYVESNGYLLPSGFTSRSDVEFRHGFRKGFSARMGPKALKELSKMAGVTVSDVPMLYPSVPTDQTPYGVEQIYDDPNVTATSGGAGITIAHLDTGVLTAHPDLINRIVGCLDATNGLANGCADNKGHGTHTAGTAVADGGDGTGIYGVAPEADLFVIKVCNPGCAADDVAAAISYIGGNSLAHIVTMSFGGNSDIGLISDVIAEYPDILFVAASGNDGPSGGSMNFPARDANVVAVGAIDSSLKVPNFSSRGVDDGDDSVISVGELELVAAGVSVLSTFNDGAYIKWTGTSMSTPHIAGLAAREWQGDAASTRAYLRGGAQDILLATGGGVATGFDVASGYGLPHVSAAAPPPPPVVTLDSIQVSPSSASIMVGETQQFSALAFYSDSTQADVTDSAQWGSSNGSVATIDGSGMADGLSEGNSSITATLDGVTSNIASLDVTEPPPPPGKSMIHIGDLDGKARASKRGWRTSVKIVVLDSDGNTVSKANVSGTWDLGTFSCTTNGKGRCTVRSGNIDLGTTEVIFRVSQSQHDGV